MERARVRGKSRASGLSRVARPTPLAPGHPHCTQSVRALALGVRSKPLCAMNINRAMPIIILLVAGCTGESKPSTGGAFDGVGFAQMREFSAHRVSSDNPDTSSNDDSKRPIPGETITLADLKGPGVVSHIWLTIAGNEYGWPRLLRLRVYYDGSDGASVDAPVGDIFGVGHGLERPVNSLMVRNSSSGRSRNEYWNKGATSGHFQHVRELHYDCDGDTLLVLVEQTGGACHTGDFTCFDGRWLSAPTGARPPFLGSNRAGGSLPEDDASSSECDGQAREKDAGSVRSGATDATEDALSCRPVCSDDRGFVLRQPPTRER